MKKRILSFCLCFILLFALSVSASASETYEYPVEEMGLTLEVPEEFISTIGMFEIFPMGEADTGINVMMFEYVALSEEDYFALIENEDISEEDQARVRSAMREMAYVFAIDGNRTLSDLINTLDLGSYPAENFSEIGKTEDVTFYLMIDKEGDSAYTASIAPEFAEEYTTLQAGLAEVLKSASFERPQAPGADLVGQVLSFESEDIDGNPVSSEDIFSQHEITMVNIWATWCGPCKSELEELGEIDRRLSSKDCAILGICIDADESPDEARALISENRKNKPRPGDRRILLSIPLQNPGVGLLRSGCSHAAHRQHTDQQKARQPLLPFILLHSLVPEPKPGFSFPVYLEL